jgi:hypothetical protein
MSAMIAGEFQDVGAAQAACRELGRRGFSGTDIRLVWSGARPGARVVVRTDERRWEEAATILRSQGGATPAPRAGDPTAPVKSIDETDREREVSRATHAPGGVPRDVF